MNGIGGRTVEEAQRNMSWAEAMQWMEFIGKRGTLNFGMRLEILMSQLMECVMAGKKKRDGSAYTFKDWAIHLDKPELTIENAISALGAKEK
jgi:hypothetical protein